MLPVYTLFLLRRGVTFEGIGVVGAAAALAAVAGEVPTGYVGDRIGRRNSLVVSQVLFAAVPLGIVVVHELRGFVVVFAVLGLARTFQSGSADAWLYDVLAERDRTDRFTHVRGRGGAIRRWVGAAVMVLGGALFAVEPTYPFLAAASHSALGAMILLTLPQNEQYRGPGTRPRFDPMDAFRVVREQLLQPPLRVMVLYVGSAFAAIRAVEEFVQPVAAEAFRVSMASTWVRGSEPLLLGLLYAGFKLVSAIASDSSSTVEEYLGQRRALLVIPVATGLLLVTPAVATAAVVPVFVAMESSKSLMRPITNRYLNDNVESYGRATVLSAASLVYALVTVPFLLVGGVAAAAGEVVAAVTVVGGLCLGGACALLVGASASARGRQRTPAVRQMLSTAVVLVLGRRR